MLEAKFNLITENARARPATVEVPMGRRVAVAKASGSRAFFEFHELCEMPLGAADYIALCSTRRLLLFSIWTVFTFVLLVFDFWLFAHVSFSLLL